jgi:hypothetical protein
MIHVRYGCSSLNTQNIDMLSITSTKEMARDYIFDQQRFELLGAYFSPVSSSYKKSGLAHYTHRVRMLELAVSDSDWIMVDSWEARSSEFQRTALVLEHFEAMINGGEDGGVICGGVKRNVRIMLLAGGDLIQSFASYEIREGVKVPVWLPSDVSFHFYYQKEIMNDECESVGRSLTCCSSGFFFFFGVCFLAGSHSW